MLDKSDAPDKGENDSCDENNDEDQKSQDSTEHNWVDLDDEEDELYGEHDE